MLATTLEGQARKFPNFADIMKEVKIATEKKYYLLLKVKFVKIKAWFFSFKFTTAIHISDKSIQTENISKILSVTPIMEKFNL